ncbi:MAG: hypothetical protein AAB458_00585 [Patescibacteria group bacterium]
MTRTFSEHPRFTSIITFLLIFFGIVLVVWLLISRDTKSSDDTTVTASTTPEEERGTALDPRQPFREARTDIENDSLVKVGSDSVAVKNQKAGDVVYVDSVTLTKSGWVAIREESSGSILGAARFDGGVWQGTIILLRAMTVGSSYSAIVFHDDGDKEFDFKKDTVVMRNDVVVSASFIAY